MRALIVSDGRPGHVRQARAFCHYAQLECDELQVRFRSPLAKAASYLLDRLGIYTARLFEPFEIEGAYDLVVGAGSATYYATKLIARRLGAKSVALMEPKGFRKDFDLIFSQAHDGGEMVANFAYAEPAGLVELGPQDVAVVVGGPNSRLSMEPERIKKLFDFVFERFGGKKVLTTSPRTPKEIEALAERYPWDYKVIYSRYPVNPIGDFLKAGTIFVTQDSVSMISEAISGGRARVEVVPLKGDAGKFGAMVERLAKEGYVHIFDGTLADAGRKVDFGFVRERVEKILRGGS
jgi:mitochondrial fission protein ELM1